MLKSPVTILGFSITKNDGSLILAYLQSEKNLITNVQIFVMALAVKIVRL